MPKISAIVAVLLVFRQDVALYLRLKKVLGLCKGKIRKKVKFAFTQMCKPITFLV